MLIDNFTAPVTYATIWEPFKSLLAVPIILDGEVWGVFCLVSKEKKSFSSEHSKFVKILISSVETTLKNIKLYEQTQRQALIDGLTGLYNQKYFKNQVSVELTRASQNKHDISVIMLDMDYFKKFNDTHGHLLGDLVLKDLAKIIKSVVKNTYVVSRYGGEEFGVLLPETSLSDASDVAEKIRTKVTQHSFVGRDQSEVKMTVSVGVSYHLYSKGNISANDFIDRADTALYRAKNEGRNQVYTAIYSEENDQLIVRRFSQNEKEVDRKNIYVFTLDKSASDSWINLFEKFSAWVISEENVQSKQINDTYKDFFVSFIIKKLMNPDIKLNAVLLEEDVEKEILSKLYFPTDFYKFEVELEEIERAIFDYIGTIKSSEIEKDHIRKIVIGIFNKVYAMAIKYTSNHYQKIIDYHMNIAHINSEIGAISTKQTFYANITKLTSEILNSRYSFIAEFDSIKKVLHIKAFYGVKDYSISEILENAGFMVHKITQRLINYADVVQLNEDEITQAFGSFKEKLDIKSVILVPLVTSDKVVTGVLACIDDKQRLFNNEEIKICQEISERIVKAITRIQKSISEKESYLEIMKSMIDLFESKDIETKDHSKNVSRLSGRISRAMNIPKEDEYEIRTSAYLHDIGKLSFSIERAKDEEYVKSHPLIGSRILNNVPELKRITQAIRHHHENWNGTG
ncbi:MAG: diguanylate cyclase, partial [Candidatus Sericytochromatia bacterium]